MLSSCLFNIYTEIMHDVLNGLNVCARIGGRRVNNIRYADDDFKTFAIRSWRRKRKGWTMSEYKNTKMITTFNIQSFSIGEEIIGVVGSFIFLGSLTHKRWKSDHKI